MHIRRFLAAALAAFMVSVLGSTAPQQAAAATDSPITIAITATVDEVSDYANLLGGAIHVGDTLTGTYTYNAAARNLATGPNVGTYKHTTAPYGMSLKAGGLVFETDPQHVDFVVYLWNNYQNGAVAQDLYRIWSDNNRPLSDHVAVQGMSWEVNDLSQTALKNVALPKTAPRLSSWDQSTGGLYINGYDSILGSPTEPFDYRYTIHAHVTQAQKITR